MDDSRHGELSSLQDVRVEDVSVHICMLQSFCVRVSVSVWQGEIACFHLCCRLCALLSASMFERNLPFRFPPQKVSPVYFYDLAFSFQQVLKR